MKKTIEIHEELIKQLRIALLRTQAALIKLETRFEEMEKLYAKHDTAA